MRKIKILCISILSIFILGCTYFVLSNKNNNVIPSFFEFKTIAHGMGGFKDTTVTNSIEAFQENYNNGVRIFEVDLIETSDNYIVARHDWENYLYNHLQQNYSTTNDLPISINEFKSLKSNLDFSPTTLDDVLNLMIEHKDIYIVTDTKTTEQEDAKRVFSNIVNKAKNLDESILRRIVPQIYNQEMINTLNSIHKFETVLYTLYMDNSSNESIIEFAKNNNIDGIVMSEHKFNKEFVKELNENGIYSYVHTINDLDLAKSYMSDGVFGIYTDFLTNNELEASK